MGFLPDSCVLGELAAMSRAYLIRFLSARIEMLKVLRGSQGNNLSTPALDFDGAERMRRCLQPLYWSYDHCL